MFKENFLHFLKILLKTDFCLIRFPQDSFIILWASVC